MLPDTSVGSFSLWEGEWTGRAMPTSYTDLLLRL